MSERMSKEEMFIADTYGYGAQSMQLIEEMAELIQAINRRRRGKTESLDEIIEEIADVELCLTQVNYLLRISENDVADIKAAKIKRELDRISEREKAGVK